jgi:hypothetical protein
MGPPSGRGSQEVARTIESAEGGRIGHEPRAIRKSVVALRMPRSASWSNVVVPSIRSPELALREPVELGVARREQRDSDRRIPGLQRFVRR